MGSKMESRTAKIVAAYVANHSVAEDALPKLIQTVYDALRAVKQSDGVTQAERAPAVEPDKSVFPDYIICLEDGKKCALLRLHLKRRHNLTPQEYRKRWGLPADYPMLAPNYLEKRRSIAKRVGLGKYKRGLPEENTAAHRIARHLGY